MTGSGPAPGDIRLGMSAMSPCSVEEGLHKAIQWDVVPAMRTKGGHSLFSIGYPGADLTALPIAATADIIHLHWPTWTITPTMVRQLLEAERTVFVTLHDMWLFTGGCHYAGACRQYETCCMRCPQINDALNLAAAGFEDKLAAYGDQPRLHVVAPCNWMRKAAQASRILARVPVYTIPNAIDAEVFAPGERDDLRSRMGLDAADLVLLFGSFDNTEHRKGGAILIEALRHLDADPAFQPLGRVFVATFGRHSDLALPARFARLDLGEVTDDELLAGAFTLADVLCCPSIEDNYPNIVLEAASCGTPTVAFAAGGMVDMVKTGQAGVLVDEVGDSAAYARGMREFAMRHHGDLAMRQACRDHILATNAEAVVGARLHAAYAEALGRDVPRGLGRSSVALQRQAAALLSRIVIPWDKRLGSDFARFPVAEVLKRRAPNEPIDVVPVRRYREAVGPARRFRLLAVRTFHPHHSTFSGPYQFLRHLSAERYELSNIPVPLGDELVEDQAVLDQSRALAIMLGLGGFATQPNAWVAEWAIARRLRRERFDIVHFIDGELGGWLVSRLPEEFFPHGRPRLVTMLHQPSRILSGMVSREGMKRFDLLGCVSETQAEWLRAFVPDRPVAAVPHGVDTRFFCPRQGSPRARAQPPFRLLAVGHWLRDFALAFAALDQVVAAGFSLEFRIVCHNLAEPILPAYVTHLQGLSDEALRDEYREATLLFMPLKAATANNAILESMASGTPVVTTATGGVTEYLDRESGRLCAPDPDALAAAVIELVQDPDLLDRLRRGARARAEKFDWAAIAQRYDELYSSVLAPWPAHTERLLS